MMFAKVYLLQTQEIFVQNYWFCVILYEKHAILFLISKPFSIPFVFCIYLSNTEFLLVQWNFLVSRNCDNCFVSTSLLQKAPCNGGGGVGWEGAGLNVQNETAKLHISKWIGGIFKIVSLWYQQLYSRNTYLLWAMAGRYYPCPMSISMLVEIGLSMKSNSTLWRVC